MELDQYYLNELEQLAAKGNLRRLPQAIYKGKWVEKEGQCLLNLSSNDYLGLASDTQLREEFMETLSERDFLFSASSSRLLTGNFPVYAELEELLADLYQAEGALVLDSGYHMNVGILPAVTDAQTLILADKLVHASLIDGIRLSAARCIRYRHQDYGQLESLVEKYQAEYPRMVIVTESVFSMDGDVTDLLRLVALKRRYPQVMLYVDEAHAVGVRGTNGLGVAEEQGCIADIDFLCGTFGKALASVGAFVICRKLLRDYLVNKMRTLIFTTALPPLNIAWTRFVVAHLPQWQERRKHLQHLAAWLREDILSKGYVCPSQSHIVPLTIGASERAIEQANALQRKGFYVLPVRPPTVPEGTSRLRFSLTAAVTEEEVKRLMACITPKSSVV
ncbi:MAG: 8-amino-7-oxononanoate synthase [Bacteroidaceae bacterium]|nr:8-amino-7-oxononanoate synthase [Bacteroidaceae bacterium]